MNTPIPIADLGDERIAPYTRLTERQLLNRRNPAEALFIAESAKVIEVALAAGLQPQSFLCEQSHLDGVAAPIIARCPEVPVFTGPREVMERLTGYNLNRGILCAMHRPAPTPWQKTIERARRIAVFDGVVDNTNIGAMFRSAAALGIDAVLLTPTSCDPLNRRSVRVSMGTVFLVPWARIPEAELLKEEGFKTVAMALTDRSVAITDPALAAEPRLAVILGNEGDGLPAKTIEKADYTVRIPMQHGVDSLNVGAAAAIAFWQLAAATPGQKNQE